MVFGISNATLSFGMDGNQALLARPAQTNAKHTIQQQYEPLHINIPSRQYDYLLNSVGAASPTPPDTPGFGFGV